MAGGGWSGAPRLSRFHHRFYRFHRSEFELREWGILRRTRSASPLGAAGGQARTPPVTRHSPQDETIDTQACAALVANRFFPWMPRSAAGPCRRSPSRGGGAPGACKARAVQRAGRSVVFLPRAREGRCARRSVLWGNARPSPSCCEPRACSPYAALRRGELVSCVQHTLNFIFVGNCCRVSSTHTSIIIVCPTRTQATIDVASRDIRGLSQGGAPPCCWRICALLKITCTAEVGCSALLGHWRSRGLRLARSAASSRAARRGRPLYIDAHGNVCPWVPAFFVSFYVFVGG